MLRSPRDTLCSDFRRFNRSEDLLVEATKLLAEHLRSLEPDSYRCLHFSQLPLFPKQLEAHFQFLFPKNKFNFENAVHQFFKTEQNACNMSDLLRGSPSLGAKLELAQAELEELCRVSDSLLQ